MIEQERFQNVLQQIHQVIVAADMRQFVGENGFQLSGRQPH